MREQFRCILFDLDGTLVDTAPDMVRVLSEMLIARDRPTLDYALARSFVSNGSLGLVQLGFPDEPAERQRLLQTEYLERYEAEVHRDSTLFPGLDVLLDGLDRGDIAWGVVTNKPARMTHPLLDALSLSNRAACIVSGDTLPERKPHPAPLNLASRLTGVAQAQTLYVGDAERDIAAGRAAGMTTVAAKYGYITPDDDVSRWGADRIAEDPIDLTTSSLKAVNLAVT